MRPRQRNASIEGMTLTEQWPDRLLRKLWIALLFAAALAATQAATASAHFASESGCQSMRVKVAHWNNRPLVSYGECYQGSDGQWHFADLQN
jgi:hypothetical protein